MIPLRLKASTDVLTEPFVVRLGDATPDTGALHGHLAGDLYATLLEANAREAIYKTSKGDVRIEGLDHRSADGDVLLIVPRQQLAHRLIRASSPHNTFLVTERCDQLCVMCSQPPKKYHTDLFAQFETAAILAPVNATIGISGGEPTLFKDQLRIFLQSVLKKRADLRFHVLTNAQHFDEADRGWLQDLPIGSVIWGIPLYSPLASQHDEIVGKAGAFDRLMKSFAILGSCGAVVELRTVILKANVELLPLLATTIASRISFIATWAIMHLESIGYGRKNWDALFFDNSQDFSSIGRALDIARGRGVEALLYNFPLCTVPAPYRKFAPSTISDWKRKYLDCCGQCSLQTSCGGFFEWYPEERGFARLGL